MGEGRGMLCIGPGTVRLRAFVFKKEVVSLIEGFEHVGIGVQDIEKAKAFYHDVLGYQVFSEREVDQPRIRKLVFMRNNNNDMVELLHIPSMQTSNEAAFDTTGLSHVCYRVGDFPAEVDRWAGLGIPQVVPPSPTADGGMRTVFRGPSGEFIELRGR